MIRINLAKRKTASIAAEQGAAGGGLLSRLRESLRGGGSGGGGSLAEWPIRSLVIALVAVYGSQFFFENEKASALAELDAQVEKLRQAQQELQSKLAQRAALEERLKEFAANESLVKTKLDTITQQNTAMVDDMAASAQTLAHTAQAVKETVQIFKLPDAVDARVA